MSQVRTDPALPTRTAARRRTLLVLVTVVALAAHLWGLYRDHGPPTPTWFPQADKLEHLVGFGLPCFLVLVTLHVGAATTGRALRPRTVGIVVGLFVVHAVVSEIVQGALYTTRTADPYDSLADVTGTALGLGAYLGVRHRGRR